MSVEQEVELVKRLTGFKICIDLKNVHRLQECMISISFSRDGNSCLVSILCKREISISYL